MLRTSAPRRSAIYRGISQGIVGLMEVYDPKVVGRICDWTYEARLHQKLSPQGTTEQVQEFITIFGRSAGPWFRKNEPAAVVKARFDVLAELDEDEAAAYAMRLWGSGLPYPRRSWALVDFHLMAHELLTVAAGKVNHEDQLYARLGFAIAPVLRSTAPSPLPVGFSPEEYSDWLVLLPAIAWSISLELGGDRAGVAAATVALAYLELHGHDFPIPGARGKVGRVMAAMICNRLLPKLAAADAKFFSNYRAESLRIFG